MKRFVIFALLLSTLLSLPVQADDMEYRRSSIYSIMIKHRKQPFADDISEAFNAIPVPDKYNCHDLSVKVVSTDEKKLDDSVQISDFLTRNAVASRLVARWFNRDAVTGRCDMELVKERGLYNASEFDKQMAKYSARGNALLEDAGEELIGNTFVIVNDIRYIDRSKGSSVLGTLLRFAGAAASIATGKNFTGAVDKLASMSESYKGFKVKIHTYLYKLVWDEASSTRFYQSCYSDGTNDVNVENFEKMRSSFRLQFVGEQESSGSNVSFLGIREDEPLKMVRKACQRALDENVANLQRNFDVFKVKVPLLSAEPITAEVGMKEGMTKNSKYEVLEKIETEDGRTVYRRVGTVVPEEGKIWDNRYMAKEEKAEGADLKYTTFRKQSGGPFHRGMLIREIR